MTLIKQRTLTASSYKWWSMLASGVSIAIPAYTPHRDDNFGCIGDLSSRELNEKPRDRP